MDSSKNGIPLPATHSLNQAVLGIVQAHFTRAVALARRFQEAQLDLGLASHLDSGALSSDARRRAVHEKLAKLDIILREHRSHYRVLMTSFDSQVTAAHGGSSPARSGKSTIQSLIALLQQRAKEQAETFRMREEWAKAARDLLALIENHAAHIQFDAEGPVFEDPELVGQCGRLTDRIARIANRETDFAAQQRLRMLETAQRLGVRVG
jgi:hypothetical protein